MSDFHPESHATTTVHRDADGSIRDIVCRAEYYEEKENDVGENEYEEGTSAKYRFDVVDGDLAVLDSIKDINGDKAMGYDLRLSFLRTLPIAERAVEQIPGIENVQDAEEQIEQALRRGKEALQN